MHNDVRLIDANAFIEDIKTEALNLFLDGLKGTPRPYRDLYDIIDRIGEQPTIDAEPVRHGRWVWFENRPVTDADDPDCIGRTGYECSECGNNEGTCIRFYEELSPDVLARIKEGLMEHLTNYCPNCGAKMDGDPDV